MTLQEEAYKRIDQMTDDGVRTLINLIDMMRTVSVTGFKNSIDDTKTDLNISEDMTKKEKKQFFMQSAGRIRIDASAVDALRKRSMI